MDDRIMNEESLEEKIKSEQEKTWKKVINDAEKKAGMEEAGATAVYGRKNDQAVNASKDSGRKSNKGLYFLMILLFLALAGNAALNVINLKKLGENKEETDKVVKYLDKKEIYAADQKKKITKNSDGTTEKNGESAVENVKKNGTNTAYSLNNTGDTYENDVIIAGSYIIKSTEKISDAYKSGDKSGLSDREKETLDMAEKVINEVIKPGMSDYEKEKAIYDWMTSNLATDAGMLAVIPSSTADVDNPYGVLKFHNAVCVGYATTFRLFMQMMDIECKVVHNIECVHSWDLVKIDGNWYHTDIYSDVGSGNYQNFNLNDDMMSRTNMWDRTALPVSESLECNEFYKQARAVKNIYDIPKDIREAYDNKKDNVCYIFDKGAGDEDCVKAITMIEEIRMRLNDRCEGEVYIESNAYLAGDKYLVIVSLHWIENNTFQPDPSEELSAEDQQKMEEAINDAFSDKIGYYEYYGNYSE
ncbi:MAG: hypothetical protein K6C35_10445 [Eubacterium sp.]|nr:hypothetical protein [Eubacterium sp.]